MKLLCINAEEVALCNKGLDRDQIYEACETCSSYSVGRFLIDRKTDTELVNIACDFVNDREELTAIYNLIQDELATNTLPESTGELLSTVQDRVLKLVAKMDYFYSTIFYNLYFNLLEKTTEVENR